MSEDAKVCRKKYELLIGPIRDEAKRLGYAVGVHGSIARDIDLIACPWTKDAVTARELAKAIGAVIERVNGVAYQKEGEREEYFQRGQPGDKPHGRLAWNWHLGGGPYIDLSVMPRTEPAELSSGAVVLQSGGTLYIGVNDESGAMEQVEFFRDKLRQKEVISVIAKSELSEVQHRLAASEQQLTAATARAEQAEAACAAAKEAYRILDTHYAPFAVTHRFMMPSEEKLQQLRRLLDSASGKSTADELRKIKELSARAVQQWRDGPYDALYETMSELEKITAQPERAERSE